MSKKLICLISFILVLGLVLTSVTEGADPSLVGWWRLDEGNGTNVSDSSGYGNHGTINGDPQWIEGFIGKALQFEGVEDYDIGQA